jgi:hypothetical protein
MLGQMDCFAALAMTRIGLCQTKAPRSDRGVLYFWAGDEEKGPKILNPS